MTELTKKAAVETIGQRRLSLLISRFSEALSETDQLSLDDTVVEYALQSASIQAQDNAAYIPYTDVTLYVASVAGVFLEKGAKALGTSAVLMRAGDTGIALTNAYEASMFFARGICGMLGVIQFDYAEGDKRKSWLIDLFPALSRSSHQIRTYVDDLDLKARAVQHQGKWEHADVFACLARLLLQTTRWEGADPHVRALRQLRYRDSSGIRNRIVYGREPLPFSMPGNVRPRLSEVFDEVWDDALDPFSRSPDGHPIFFAWKAFSLARALAAQFYAPESLIGSAWNVAVFGNESELDFRKFYWTHPGPLEPLKIA